MSRYHAYVKRAGQVIESYTGHPPMAALLKGFFRQFPNMGSGDRKWVSRLVYAYFRCKPVLDGSRPLVEQIGWAHGLLTTTPDPITELLPTDFQALLPNPAAEKLAWLGKQPTDLFPWTNLLSPAVDGTAFAHALLHQPDVFLRARPGKQPLVLNALQNAKIPAVSIGLNLIQIPPNSAIDKWLALDKDVVVQDRSSAQLYDGLVAGLQALNSTDSMQVWDCCAASGGKSILLIDLLAPRALHLTATDKRASILYNLQQRFHRAGIKRYTHYVKDLSLEQAAEQEVFDLILADVPCSGSGTWARTPEQVAFFSADQLHHYQQLQQRIVTNALPALKHGGWLVYSTCSVFKQENEQQAAWIQGQLGLELMHQAYLLGYGDRADSLFVAAFRKL